MSSIYAFDDFEFDVGELALRRAGAPLKADALILRLLEVFVRRPGQLITKQELAAQVWSGRAVTSNALNVAINRLRKTLSHDRHERHVLSTVHGRGYRFLCAVSVRDPLVRLDQAASGALSCAALIGRSFDLGLLQAITGRSAADLMASLDAAIASDVLRPARDSRTEFEFSHERQRTALYESLEPGQRRTWHARAVEALDRRRAHGGVSASELAHHAWSALPAGDLHKAVNYCVEAANAAESASASADALRYVQHARQALELIEDTSSRERYAVLLREVGYARA